MREITFPKIIKDLIADGLIGAAASLAAVNIVAIPTDQAGAAVAGMAIANALVHSLYRFALKWATS